MTQWANPDGGMRSNIPYLECPNVMFSVGWGEDIDLSGGAAVIATLIGQRPDFRDGADELLLPNNCNLKRLWASDETVAQVTGGLLVSDKALGGMTKTIWRQNVGEIGDFPILMHEWPGDGMLLKKGAVLSYTAPGSGSGAEQHVLILDMHSPEFTPKMQVGNPFDADGLHIAHGLKTGALTVATISGKNDILGHLAAYEDSELEFGISPEKTYTVYSLIHAPGVAGVGVCGLLHPSLEFGILRPGTFASAVQGMDFPLDQTWGFNGEEKSGPRLVAAGAVTTSTEYVPRFVAHGLL